GSAAGKGSGSDAGEIEMDQDSGKGSGSAKGSGKGSAVNEGEIQMDEDTTKTNDLSADLAAQDKADQAIKAGPVKKTPISWADILVVVRKPFLKVRRTELYPFTAVTMNDNMIRHYTIGGEFNYYLTDVLAVGVEGQYYTHSFQEPFDLV